nr:MAG TPA: hypothetical protein [Caudoviricetes sp.]
MCIDISDCRTKLLIMPLPLTADGIVEPHIKCIRLIGKCIATFINPSLKSLFVLRPNVSTVDELFITDLVTVSVLYAMLRPARNHIHLMIYYHLKTEY